ncbi:NTP/NDP exchange transporter [Rosistilla oblonga]|uniref:NTP/NDP exchange transporter n=1 Tax=Rosistilla oblonga TaxID=2527990 RepID=UPI003A9804ED
MESTGDSMMGFIRQWQTQWTAMSTDQRRRAAWAFAWFFCILLAYFVIRPVRETMGIQGGTKQLPWLFLGTFTTMLIAVPIYSFVVARCQRKRLVPIVYRFFALNLLLFWFAMHVESAAVHVWVARCFFIWTSVFSLFNTSVFWSVLADLYDSRQAKRVFGMIAVGGTLGAIVGSLLTSLLSTILGVQNLLWLPIVLLEVGVFCAGRMMRAEPPATEVHDSDGVAESESSTDSKSSDDEPAPGGGIFEGITHVARSPYLAMICLFLLLGQLTGTHFYLVQAELVKEFIPERDAQTALFGKLNLFTQLLTLGLQAGVVGLVLRRMGVAAALVLLPIVCLLALIGLGLFPSIAVLAISDVVRRGVVYGVTVPSREVLFTVVDRADKYKSKSFIDTVVVRGGDAISGQAFAFVRQWQLGLAAMNALMIPVVIVWGILAIYLGRQQTRRAAAGEAD